MSFGFWASTVAFVVIEGDALLDQSEIGHASILFMLGTACLAAGACNVADRARRASLHPLQRAAKSFRSGLTALLITQGGMELAIT